MDNGQKIDIEISTDVYSVNLLDGVKSNTRILLGYIAWEGETSEDIKFTIKYKRDKGSSEESYEYTITKGTIRYYQKLPPRLTCIEFSASITGTIGDTFEMEVFKVGIKPVSIGKYG